MTTSLADRIGGVPLELPLKGPGRTVGRRTAQTHTDVAPPVVVVAYGLPIAQGSKVARKRKDGSSYVADANASKLEVWRDTVAEEARVKRVELGGTILGYVAIHACFTFPKPDTAYRGPKSKKPRQLPAGKDIDKCLRAVFDSLGRSVGAGLIEDDRKVIEVTAVKSYPGEHPSALDCPGVRIEIRRLLP